MTFPLSDGLVRTLESFGLHTPTAVQAAAIPGILESRDVWACAPTGSGKTYAFVLPIVELLAARERESPRPVRALVVVPTRELALQIAEVATRLETSLKVCVAVGGASINPQMMALRGGADFVVGTPGRLLDLVEHNALRLSSVEMLVLDEADRLLSLGFADELDRVLALLPEKRQNLLFSATFPAAVQALASDLLRDPLRIEIDRSEVLAGIEQRAIEVDVDRRTMLLRHLLDVHGWPRVLVFVATRHAADHVAEKLNRAGITAASLHGELSQGGRIETLADLKDERLRVLVATDLAARGIDIAQLPAVVNYDLPRSPTDYVHRIGRTGRAGEKGVAVSFITADSHDHFRLIERRHELDIPREQLAGFEPKNLAVPQRDPNGGIKGKRKSKKDKLREARARTEGSR